MVADRYAADELEAGYRIECFADQDEVSAEDILGLWRRENVIPDEVAQKRVREVHLVALNSEDGVVGLSSAYLRRNAQLQLDLWDYRAFVGGAHRKSNVAVNLAVTGRNVLQQQFVSREDVRGQGIVTFVGVNPRCDHVRVRYFPGALAPEPAQ